MNIFIVGGTGFLGYHAALEARRRGHTVTALGLPPIPSDEDFTANTRLLLQDLEHTSDDDLRARWTDHVPVTFVDGRVLSYWVLDADRLRAALASAS